MDKRIVTNTNMHRDGQILGDAHEGNGQAEVGDADLDFEPVTLEAKAPTVADDDDYDLSKLRLDPNITTPVAEKVWGALPIDKPGKGVWVRVDPRPEYRVQTAGLEITEGERGKKFYLAPTRLHSALAVSECFRPAILALAVTRHRDYFIWPIYLPKEGDRTTDWPTSALEAMDQATTVFTKIKANMRTGRYDKERVKIALPEPEWPDIPFPRLLRLSFKDRFIDSLDHPVWMELEGNR